MADKTSISNYFISANGMYKILYVTRQFQSVVNPSARGKLT